MEPTKLVRFEMTKDDFLAFNLYHHRNSPSIQAQQRGVLVLLVVVGLLVGLIPLLRPAARALWAVSAVFIGAACLLPFNFNKAARRIVDKMLSEGQNKGLLGLKEVTLSPAEIGTTGALRSASTRWPAVERIVTTDEALYVYVSALEALIVPRRAFETPQEFEDFAATARRFQAEAAGRSK